MTIRVVICEDEPLARETLRDFGNAQSFRRDVFRRGLAPLGAAEQPAILANLRVVPILQLLQNKPKYTKISLLVSIFPNNTERMSTQALPSEVAVRIPTPPDTLRCNISSTGKATYHRGAKDRDEFEQDGSHNTPVHEYCQRFAARGYVCFSVGYRLTQELPAPQEHPIKRQRDRVPRVGRDHGRAEFDAGRLRPDEGERCERVEPEDLGEPERGEPLRLGRGGRPSHRVESLVDRGPAEDPDPHGRLPWRPGCRPRRTLVPGPYDVRARPARDPCYSGGPTRTWLSW